MSSEKGSIFKARTRKRPQLADVSNSTTLIEDSYIAKRPNTIAKPLYELTKNEKYCVTRLPALPSIFENDKFQTGILNAYADSESNYSLVVTENSLHVWNYKSTDPSPLSFQFPINDSNSKNDPIIPLSILTRPSSGISQDPGLVIINSTSGLVKFYESVQHAPALGLINDKSLELILPINSNRGEYITLAENVEPAGIAIATSWKRCILISLRDFKSKPKLSTIELIPPISSTSIISNFFSRSNSMSIENDIVSIKSGKITNHGMTQEIIIQDSKGGFNFFVYQLSSANGLPYVDKKNSYKHNLTSYVENSIDGFIPGSALSINFLDLWPLLDHDNVYLGLCHIVDATNIDKNSKNLLLITIKIDSTGGLLYGSHKLIRYDPSDSEVSSINKPKLFLPKPSQTAFITIENSVIITDINTSYIESQNPAVSYYSPRWEDIVRLKSNVEIVGYGFENQSTNANPSIVIISKNFGVLRIERFPESEYSQETNEKIITDPVYIIKSHIEQGIFFANSQEIEFDIKATDISKELIFKAIDSIILEIINSKSVYLPEFLPSIVDSLNQKSELYKHLIDYSKRNFPTLVSELIPKIVQYLEKVEVALNLWNFINEAGNQSNHLKELLESITVSLKKTELESDGNGDIIRKLFNQGIDYINLILTRFIDTLIDESFSTTDLVQLLILTQYNGIFLIESQYLSQSFQFGHKLWIFDTSLLVTIGNIYQKEYNEVKDDNLIITSQEKSNLIKLCEVLYYFVINVIHYFEQNDPSNEQLNEYKNWYNSNKKNWINALLKYNLNEEAIKITENYKDFSSLAMILDIERFKFIDKNDTNSLNFQKLIDRYSEYFQTFGYEFAANLYDYYLNEDKIQPLLLDFTNYKNYLKQYFEKNPVKTANVAWIRQLLDQDFSLASESLITSVIDSDNLDNKELKFSLAKLAIIASKENDSMSMEISDKPQELLNEAESNLIQVRAQSKLFQLLIKYVHGEKKLLTLDYILKNHSNKSIPLSIRNHIIESQYNSFISNIQLSSLSLINLFTIIKPANSNGKEFAEALKVSSSLSNESQSKFFTKLIWLRLLTVTDDWTIISKLNSKYSTDEHIKNKIHDTIIFKTLLEIKSDSGLILQLDTLLSTGQLGSDNYENDEEINVFNQSLIQQLNEHLANKDFTSWIESIKQEVKNSV
ncbi:Non-repetitive/WGA-negative nucleoporin C-terminal-domain-containing protein [Scheffersomyces amazonensis]|uniref:Non-repetitive/WGA-negative nucleoporin C-terminal-domain-containing protein n=1 Tax=Scheffersomyces amazonensis TaxID=1078765 RepID=UPI00315CEDA1